MSRRIVRAKAKISVKEIEEAVEKQTLDDGTPPSRAHVISGLIYQVAFQNLSEAEALLEEKDFILDCHIEMLDPQAKRSKDIRDKIKRELLDS